MIGFLFLCMLNFSAAIDEKYDMMAKTCYGDNAFTSTRINSGYLRVRHQQLRLELVLGHQYGIGNTSST